MKNYNSLIFLFILLFLSTALFGQTNKVEVGVVGGPGLRDGIGNSSWSSAAKPAIGFSTGVSFRYNLNSLFSIRTGLNYEKKGYRFESIFTNPDGSIIGKGFFYSNFDYLTLPVLVRASFGEKLKLFVNAGPYFGYLLKQSDFLDINLDYDNSFFNTVNTEQFRRFDLGLSAGVGVAIPVNTKINITLEVQDNLSFTSFNPNSSFFSTNTKFNSTNLLIGLTYQLGQRSE